MITLAESEAIIVGALAKAAELACSPLSVAVLDAGGHLVAFRRQDGSGIMRFEISFGKAWGALGMGRPSRRLAKQAEERPQFAMALVGVSSGRYVPVPGGVLIRDSAGQLLGAVGVSGDSAERDETCAVAGILAAGLAPETD